MCDTQPVKEPEQPAEMPRERGEQPLLAFGADLTKEEFIAFSLTAGRDPRRTRQMRSLSAVSTGLMTVMCLYFIYDAWRFSGEFDWQTFALLVLVLLLGLFSLFGAPQLFRRRAAVQYEQSRRMGYSYHGVVRVYARRIEKETADRLTVIPLNRETRFLEREDVMALAQPGQPSLILFARYLNEDAARCVRDTVMANIPPENCQLLSRLRPAAEGLMPPPVFEQKEEEPPQRFILSYTEEEYYQLTKEMLYTTLSRQLPLLSGGALVCGVILWLASADPVMGAGTCAALLLLIYLTRVLLPLRRAKAAAQRDGEQGTQIILSVTKREILLSVIEGQPVTLPWQAITRAVSEPDYIRLYAEKQQAVVIPKRCLADVDEFCRMVDAYMEVASRGES